MGKYKYKKKRKPTQLEEARSDLRGNLRKFNWKLLGELVVAFAIIFSLYQVGVWFEFKPILPIYTGALSVLLAAFILINRGFSGTPITADQLNESWTDEQKNEYVENDKKRKKLAKKLLIVIIPITLTLTIDTFYLMFMAGL